MNPVLELSLGAVGHRSLAMLYWSEHRRAQVPVGSVRKGQSATLAIHPLSARQPLDSTGAHSHAPLEELNGKQPGAVPQREPAAGSQAAPKAEQNGNASPHGQAPSSDPHALPDTALRIQRVSFSTASEVSASASLRTPFAAAGVGDFTPNAELPSGIMAAVASQERSQTSSWEVAPPVTAEGERPLAGAVRRAPLQSPLSSASRAPTPSQGTYHERTGSGGEQHRAAMPEGTLGVAAADLDGLAAETQVRHGGLICLKPCSLPRKLRPWSPYCCILAVAETRG